MALARSSSGRIPPDVNRILYVKNLSFKTSGEDLYELFGRYGGIRQIRIGNSQKTRGTAFVVYEDIFDAKNAYDNLNGFHLQDRYLVVLYHAATKTGVKADLARREAELEAKKKAFDIKDEE
ncbi:RNA-binding domain-containing protein [Cystobasidium minutum MCA 4210]|uniref:RNA-binding domain-containing protein n=1 Tax=Cystobasidium minutum MCA 4210 TaxID=1397322 RepID=UPI0034CFA8EF|eukprot:jgi/Rhomi1/99854/CE99853_883